MKRCRIQPGSARRATARRPLRYNGGLPSQQHPLGEYLMHGRVWLIVGALVAGSAVGFGALGAHWFEGQAKKLYADEVLRERREANWETGAQYQIYHGLAIVAAGLAAFHTPMKRWSAAAALFTLGALLFSGSLYLIALSGAPELKAIPMGIPLIIATPVGGMCFLFGWGIFLVAALGMKTTARDM